jgi:poly(hydroxyalkanoate) depolymerase family esterase
MRNISDTIMRLRARKFAAPPVGWSGEADRLTDLVEFGANPGKLRARIYIPEDLPNGAPLVVVLHGCTQSAAAYDQGSGWSRRAEQHGFALLFPEQQRINNANLCFNWFVPEDIRRDAGEAASIRQMVEAMVVAHGIDISRIFVTGLSAGGAMASVMLAAYPDVFAGGAVIAGLPYGSASTVPEAFDRMRGHGGPSDGALQALLRGASSHDGPWPTISVWQGAADLTVSSSNADRIVAQWRGVHRLPAQPTRIEAVGGHDLRTWHDPKGRVLIELHSIAGMGHGTPIDASAVEGGSTAGPFMLDVGISSTLEIARFWGLAPVAKGGATRIRPAARIEVPDRRINAAAAPRQAARQPEQTTKGIGKVIEDALRAAGLMK